MVDENAFMDIIARCAFPSRRYQKPSRSWPKDRILAQAQEEANRTVQLARKSREDAQKSEIFQTIGTVAQVADQARAELPKPSRMPTIM